MTRLIAPLCLESGSQECTLYPHSDSVCHLITMRSVHLLFRFVETKTMCLFQIQKTLLEAKKKTSWSALNDSFTGVEGMSFLRKIHILNLDRDYHYDTHKSTNLLQMKILKNGTRRAVVKARMKRLRATANRVKKDLIQTLKRANQKMLTWANRVNLMVLMILKVADKDNTIGRNVI